MLKTMIMAIVKNLSVIMHPSQKSNKKTVISLLILKTNIRGIRLKRETGKGERHTKKNTRQSDRINCGQSSVQFSSVTQSCLTFCDPMNRSTPGLPVYHQLQEFTQTHVHRVSDAIQPSHPLSSPSPPAPNPSQHQDLFQ